MSNQIISTELFVDVTEEQQQIVAGGSGYPKFVEDALSKYKQKMETVGVKVVTAAGPDGATTIKEFDFKKGSIESVAKEFLSFPF